MSGVLFFYLCCILFFYLKQVWACEYIIPLALTKPGPVDTWPRANRWLGGKFGKRKVGHNLKQLRKTLKGLRNHHVRPINSFCLHVYFLKILSNLWLYYAQFNIDPWVEHGDPPSYVTASKEATEKRILFHGPAGYAWYLGERVTIQSLRTSTHLTPHEPPGSMMADYEYTDVERTDGIVGWPCERFIDKELDYTTFMEEYVKYHEYPDTETDEEVVLQQNNEI